MAAVGPHNLNGKVAIITGSSAGIGAAIALQFVKLGASVTIHGRRQDKLAEVKNQCKQLSAKKEEPLVITGDILDENVRVKLIEQTVKRFGKLDIVVNNAGYFEGDQLNSDFKFDRLQNMLTNHVIAPFHLTKLAIPHLEKTKGNIINISSIASKVVHWDSASEYAIAKAGQNRMTEVTARELGPKAIRVNSILPGAIKTELLTYCTDQITANSASVDEIFVKLHSLQRLGEVEEVATMAGFLASDSASFMTGANIPVDGGFLIN